MPRSGNCFLATEGQYHYVISGGLESFLCRKPIEVSCALLYIIYVFDENILTFYMNSQYSVCSAKLFLSLDAKEIHTAHQFSHVLIVFFLFFTRMYSVVGVTTKLHYSYRWLRRIYIMFINIVTLYISYSIYKYIFPIGVITKLHRSCHRFLFLSHPWMTTPSRLRSLRSPSLDQKRTSIWHMMGPSRNTWIQ